MKALRIFLSRLLGLLGGNARRDRELRAEIDAHIAEAIGEFRRQGMTADRARHRALREFGGVTQIIEACREQRRIPLFSTLRQDLHYAVRTLTRAPGFALVVILTLGLGIGANTAIFSVVNAVLIRPLPYKDADRLVRAIQERRFAEPGETQSGGISTEAFKLWRERTQTLSHIGVFEQSIKTLSSPGETPARLRGAEVSPSLFSMLAVQPELGRAFSDTEEKPGNNAVILSHHAWQKHFGSNARILGRAIVLNGVTYPVVGVMPASFEFPDRDTMFWVPFVIQPPVVYAPGAGEVEIVQTLARLKGGATIAQAAAEANILGGTSDPSKAIHVLSLKEELIAPVRPALMVLAGCVGFVLLIACANVANLLLSRAASRRREMAIRATLGAGRGRLLRQTMTESLMLAALGGVAGIALAFWGVPLLVALDPGNIPRLRGLRIDAPVFAFTIAISLLTGVLFGLAPALRLSRLDRIQAVTTGEIAGGNRTRSLLVMSEIAMAMILLAAAGVLAKGFLKLSQVDTGIDAERVLTFEMSLPEARYKKGQRNRLAEEFLTELRSQPGVTVAALSNALPSQRSRIWTVENDSTGGRVLGSYHEIRVISSGYVKAAGMTLVAGRDLNEDDRAGQPLVVLVNRTYAKRFGSAASAIGRFIRGVDDAYAVPRPRAAQIVGVVEDVQPVGLDRVIQPEVFTDYRQDAAGYYLEYATFFTVRTAGDPASVTANARALLRRMDPELMIESVGMLTERLADSVAQPRFYAVLVGIFATVAVTLAAVGIYGVMMFAVSQRTREIGIRMAMGAGRRAVLGLVLRQGAMLAGAGIGLGLAGAFALTRYLQTLIFGITTFDPQVFAILSGVLGAITVLACYLPARRATRIDPIVALRSE